MDKPSKCKKKQGGSDIKAGSTLAHAAGSHVSLGHASYWGASRADHARVGQNLVGGVDGDSADRPLRFATIPSIQKVVHTELKARILAVVRYSSISAWYYVNSMVGYVQL